MVGYAVKRIAKLVAVLLGVGFVLLQYLAYRGVIQLNYEDLLLHAQRLVSRFAWEGLLPLLLANLPFAGSFSVVSCWASGKGRVGLGGEAACPVRRIKGTGRAFKLRGRRPRTHSCMEAPDTPHASFGR